jgi:tetratricopeptide (TPR) repeat protein
MRPQSLLALAIACSWAAAAQQTFKAPDEAKERARLAAEHHKAKAAFVKNPNDRTVRRRYVEATVAYGNAVMLSPNLLPREKYPRALRLFREALKHDPEHRQAKAHKAMIEDIYKSMGRPVPN